VVDDAVSGLMAGGRMVDAVNITMWLLDLLAAAIRKLGRWP